MHALSGGGRLIVADSFGGRLGIVDPADADTLLAYIAPQGPKPLDVTAFTREGCEFCARAKQMLGDAGIQYEELVLNRDYTEATLRAVSGRSNVPQIFINGKHIGGSEELEQYLAIDAAA